MRGFTLIELLVVIAIIAVLMSILIPALGKAKEQVKTVICRSNMHQWGLVFRLFTTDNKNRFMSGNEYDELMDGPSGFSGEAKIDEDDHSWPLILRSYYQDHEELLRCPVAQKPPAEQNGDRDRKDTVRSTWGLWEKYPDKMIYGSYGINSYVYNRGDSERWRVVEVKGGDRIPMLLDCYWCEGYPNHYDEPPEALFLGAFGDSDNHMKRFCVDRHNDKNGAVFMDLSARSVGLKELWELEWHRNWNPWNQPPPVWPDWMAGMKDY